MKLSYDDALDAIANERDISHDDVLRSALRRVVWTQSNGLPGCMPNTVGHYRTKADAVAAALQIADAPPRGRLARDLAKYESGKSEGESYWVARNTLADVIPS